MSAESKMERLVKPTRIYARAALTQAGETLSHTEPMSTKLDDAFATLSILIADTSRDLAMAMAELRSVAAERDVLRDERDRAKENLRAAEADAAETESVNSDLRGVNKRLVADLAAATQRADTAEAILRANA